MKRKVLLTVGMVLAIGCISCNNGMSSPVESGGRKEGKRDKTQKTVIDSAEYIDFTVQKHNARNIRKEDLLYALNGTIYKNNNSSILIKAGEGSIELLSDSGVYNGKKNCQVYAVFGIDVQAAGDDCLYIRKNQNSEGFLIIDGVVFRNDAIPDLAVCLPMYGYSRNRIEISPVMDGYSVMPSGTYWRK